MDLCPSGIINEFCKPYFDYNNKVILEWPVSFIHVWLIQIPRIVKTTRNSVISPRFVFIQKSIENPYLEPMNTNSTQLCNHQTFHSVSVFVTWICNVPMIHFFWVGNTTEISVACYRLFSHHFAAKWKCSIPWELQVLWCDLIICTCLLNYQFFYNPSLILSVRLLIDI